MPQLFQMNDQSNVMRLDKEHEKEFFLGKKGKPTKILVVLHTDYDRNFMFMYFQGIFRKIICWQSRGTTMVMEVKLHYFRGRGSTTAVAVKIFSSISE